MMQFNFIIPCIFIKVTHRSSAAWSRLSIGTGSSLAADGAALPSDNTNTSIIESTYINKVEYRIENIAAPNQQLSECVDT